jgi:hypothetical protein
MAFIITLGAVKYLDATSGDPEKDIIFENPFTHEMMTVMPEGMRGGRIMHMAITMVCNDWWVVVGGVRT